jgi:ABC-2 type transport system ATP-binding protein
MMVTHHMEEVERLCDRILLLKDGVARAYGTVVEVQQQFGATTVKVDCRTGALPGSPNYRVLSDEHGVAEIELTSSAEPAAVLAELVRAGVGIEAFTPSRRSLDSIFVEVYGEQAGRE